MNRTTGLKISKSAERQGREGLDMYIGGIVDVFKKDGATRQILF